ncbi:MAG TPA: Xaa-Pro peptidase family protein, partial [Pyrinomonadaceae bacterium]|nr:Xaa-Pro peptidase family protein [Pyrinomonadaceae bacterium]
MASASTAAAQRQFDKAEFAARRARLFEQIADGVAIIFAAGPHVHAVKFRQAPDFYYLTGIEEPSAVLLMVGKTRQAFVFVRKRPRWQVNIEGPGLLDAEKPAETYGLAGVLPVEEFRPTLAAHAEGARKLYVPLTPPDSLQLSRGEVEGHEAALASHPVVPHASAVKQAVARLRELHPSVQFEDVNPLLDRMRWVKSPYEIERMRRSGRIAAEGLKAAIRGTRPGMFEYELEAAARFVQTKMGARGDAFTPIVASGPNTVTWHYQSNDRQMQAGDVVLMDYGADFDYYTSDITRTWPVSGKFTPEQEKMYLCVLEARDRLISMMKPSVTIKQMQDAAEEVYTRHGFRQQFLELGRYVGHPVGLSVHDVGGHGPEVTLRAGV